MQKRLLKEIRFDGKVWICMSLDRPGGLYVSLIYLLFIDVVLTTSDCTTSRDRKINEDLNANHVAESGRFPARGPNPAFARCRY
jgi:hypothetical protein